jgi:hypothetical protein
MITILITVAVTAALIDLALIVAICHAAKSEAEREFEDCMNRSREVRAEIQKFVKS